MLPARRGLRLQKNTFHGLPARGIRGNLPLLPMEMHRIYPVILWFACFMAVPPAGLLAQGGTPFTVVVDPGAGAQPGEGPVFLRGADLVVRPAVPECGEGSGVCGRELVYEDRTIRLIRLEAGPETATGLTDAFWNDFASELRAEADLRLVVSAMPFTGSADWPGSWQAYPEAVDRFLETVSHAAANAVLLVSAAPLCGQVAREPENNFTYTLYEVTAARSGGKCRKPEVTARQIRGPVRGPAFGRLVVELNARLPVIGLQLLDARGREKAAAKISLGEISFY